MHKIAHNISNTFTKINLLNKSHHFPIIIILGIMAYETMKINFQILFKSEVEYVGFLDSSWTLASVFGSTLLGILSDRFIKCSLRKPIVLGGMLLALIICIFLSSQSLNFSSFYLLIILSGISASYLGAIRAFYLDQYKKGRTLHLTITIVAQCIPWIVLGVLLSQDIINQLFLQIFSVGFMGISFLLILFFVNDYRLPQVESSHVAKEIKAVFKKYNHLEYWSIAITFFLLALSYQLMPYFGEYTLLPKGVFNLIFLLGIGIALGALFALITNASPMYGLKIGYSISCLYFFAHTFLRWCGLESAAFSWDEYLIYAIISGALWVFSIKPFILKSKFTEDGLILGIIESIQSFGEYLGSLVTTNVLIRKEMNSFLFLIIITIALIVISLENLRTFFEKKKKHS